VLLNTTKGQILPGQLCFLALHRGPGSGSDFSEVQKANNLLLAGWWKGKQAKKRRRLYTLHNAVWFLGSQMEQFKLVAHAKWSLVGCFWQELHSL